ncbi:MAG: DNA adenine methylase [Eubacteriales bacterium]|nr:DNA adenine methylase [Eubacteriales bacterium]
MRFIGNKTQLLENIKEVVDKHAVGAHSFCDIFSGTASVARFFKQWYEVYSNDLLYFSYCLQRATIENPSKPTFERLTQTLGILDPISYFNEMSTECMESLPIERRFFQNNYAPTGGRMYITDSNALRIDYARNTIEDWNNSGFLSNDEYLYLVACVVEGVPFVSNIAGTYGAFNKTWDIRSNKLFVLIDLPVVNNGFSNRSYNEDGAKLLQRISGDILYIDPPYNERQYLPNYHVLETAAKYDFPILRGVTGQRPYELQRSDFCSKKTVVRAFDALLENANFKHIILSYNTDGIMTLAEIEATMKKHGIASTFEVNYIPYRRFKSKSIVTKTEELKEMLIYIQKEV